MPFIVNVQRGSVAQRTDARTRLGEFVVDGETAAVCGLFDGQMLSEGQVQALRDGSLSAFRRASEGLMTDEPAGAGPTVGPGAPVGEVKGPSDLTGPGARAVAAAGVAEVIAWISGVAGVILGIALAMQKEYEGWDEYSRPYVGLGVGVALASVFQASLLIMVAAFIQWRIKAQPTGSP